MANKSRRLIKKDVHDSLGAKCACCGETRREFFHLDHPLKNGREERLKYGGQWGVYRRFRQFLKRNGRPPKGYRLLCANCNMSLGDRGYCPHDRERLTLVRRCE